MRNPLFDSDIDGNTLNIPDLPNTAWSRDGQSFDYEYNFHACRDCERPIPWNNDYCEKCWIDRKK